MEKKTVWRFLRPVLFLVSGVVVVGTLAPFINAARYSRSIQAALETSLGRQVHFDKVYFTLFSGPGFSLEGVTIGEDPAYGIEPFAYVPTLQARLRLDKLLFGEVRFTGLRLVDPTLNLVRLGDGSWNIQRLMQRLTAPRHAPLHFFPSFEVSDGRVNFKLGVRKTTLYISNSDLSIYPQHSGKIYIRFSGSPARTDRAGMGFGHVRGDITWFLNNAVSRPNQLDAQLYLDPSNLSELTTLVEGHDIGVHGTVSSQLRIEGAISDLKVAGELNLNHVHRWDLLPSSGEQWTVHYGGSLDLLAHRLDLRTLATEAGQPSPVTLRLKVRDFLSQGGNSIAAELKDAPLSPLLPLAERLGVVLPNNADLHGSLNGAVGYSSESGLRGGLSISDARAVLPGAPTLHASAVNVSVSGDRVHFSPATIEAAGQGAIEMSGNYSLADQSADASLKVTQFPVNELKPLANSWFGGLAVLSAVSSGTVSGEFAFSHGAFDAPAVDDHGGDRDEAWSGHFELLDSSVHVPGIATPLEDSQARITFSRAVFQVDHLTATLGGRKLKASYRYNADNKPVERVRVEFPSTDLSDLEDTLGSSGNVSSLWTRFRFLRHSFPTWMSRRNLEGDLVVDHLVAGAQILGALNSHLNWHGPKLQFSDVSLSLPQGHVQGGGTVDLAAFSPRWQFAAEADNYPWGGGLLHAVGQFDSSGAGVELLRNLQAQGSFDGQKLTVSADSFQNVSGSFRFTFADGWPDIRFSDLQAIQDGDEWHGDGLTQSDGKLLVNLAREGRQMHLISSLSGERAPQPLSEIPPKQLRRVMFKSGLHF